MTNVVFREVLVCRCKKCDLPKQRYLYLLINSGLLKIIDRGITQIILGGIVLSVFYILAIQLSKIRWYLCQTRVDHKKLSLKVKSI